MSVLRGFKGPAAAAKRTLRARLTKCGLLCALVLVPASSRAATALTVDLGTKLGPVTHVASGSLYGVLETQPADVMGLIAPLHPNVFNNPASDVQQPIGDAIVVAGRVAAIGGRVSIRLADWLPGWPYTFKSMSDWLDKVGQTVSRRKAANLTNIYAYEIWNEPNGTWQTSNGAFNDFWKQTYDQLRMLDPTIKITGPSTSYYQQSYLQSFLSYCKTNDCLPDIVGWHELSGGNVTSNIQSYRSMEKQLGIGPLPISINEYSGKADLTVEGQPGASASLIAKFERLGVESACISFWDVSHPGRLGSLLATNTDPNGGWWFYKWYGDMAGDMVSTTPANPADSAALDGFANVDATGKSASVLFGGVNDGAVQVTIKGFGMTSIFGATVHVVVEHTPFVNRTTAVKATDVVSTADVAVANDQIAVSVPSTNSADGYRILLTPVGGSGTGGAGGPGGGASGAGGSGPQPGSGGRSGSGGAGGVSGRGGTSGSGGMIGSGGMSGSGGATSTGGKSATTGTGGASTGSGGAPSDGGISSSGGASVGSGGVTGSTASGGASAGGTGGTVGPALSDGGASGCACAIGESPPLLGSGLAGLSVILLSTRLRTRRRRADRSLPR